MRAAAKLQPKPRHRHDSDPICVLIGKKGPGASGNRLLVGDSVVDVHGEVPPQLLVHHSFDAGNLLGRERPEVAKVETQAVRGDQRAFLTNVIPQDPMQCFMEQMCCCMVFHYLPAPAFLHRRLDPVPFPEHPSFHQNLVYYQGRKWSLDV